MKTFPFFLRLLTVVSLAIVSCNQDDAPSPTPDPDPVTPSDCRITSLRATFGTGTLTYDSDKRLISYSQDGPNPSGRTYAYSGNTIIAVSTENGVPVSRDTIVLNSAGYAVSYVSVSLPAGTAGTRGTYEYNSANKLTKASYTEPGQPANTNTYEYDASGNIAKQTQSVGAVITYTHYTDKAVQAGDPLENEEFFVFGAGKLFNNAHLVKSETSSVSGTTDHTYEFDGNGRIKTLVSARTGQTPDTTRYQQTCN